MNQKDRLFPFLRYFQKESESSIWNRSEKLECLGFLTFLENKKLKALLRRTLGHLRLSKSFDSPLSLREELSVKSYPSRLVPKMKSERKSFRI